MRVAELVTHAPCCRDIIPIRDWSLSTLPWACSRLHVACARGGKKCCPRNLLRGTYVCGDLEALPLQSGSVDMLWSSLALQWCNDLDATFSGMRRVLAPNGLLMFSTFGPDTLRELRHAFSQADGYSHVSRFQDMHDIGDALMRAGFADPVMDVEHFTLTYDTASGLMRDLKALGAHNATQGRRQGLAGKSAWKRMEAEYEKLRQDGKLPATYEVIYGHAWAPNQLPDGRQVVQMPSPRQRGR